MSMIKNFICTLAAGIVCCSPGFAQGGESGLGDLEQLLQETDAALSGKGRAGKKNAPAVPANKKEINSTSKSKSKKGGLSDSKQEKSSGEKQASPEIHAPLSDQEKHTLAVLDGMALKHELNMARPKQRVVISFASMSLRSHYLLEKDDDQFRARQGEQLQGAFISYIPNLWRSHLGTGSIGEWPKDMSVTKDTTKSYLNHMEHGVDLDITTGFFVGDLATIRSGVENGDYHYNYTLIPVDVGLSYRFQYRDWGVAALLGFGFEFVRQDGSGQYDTISDFFRGDIAGLSLTYNFIERFSVVASMKQHGFITRFRTEESRGGYANRVFALGLGLPLSS